jgi:hypothetical protein
MNNALMLIMGACHYREKMSYNTKLEEARKKKIEGNFNSLCNQFITSFSNKFK